MAYEDALQELYQVPLTQFIAERKRLADELKANGDAAAAKLLLARKRPTISAWVINQLYWHARDAFDEMLATAERLREGQFKASADHREAISKLRNRAAAILEDAGHAATEPTLRRVTTTLSALAATGSFDPDPPGALAADRDPPGFEAIGVPSFAPANDEAAEPKVKTRHHDGKDELADARAALEKRRAEDAEARRRADMADKKRAEEERKRKKAERHKLESALRSAKAELDERERAVKSLEKQLDKAREQADQAQRAVDEITAQLAEVDED